MTGPRRPHAHRLSPSLVAALLAATLGCGSSEEGDASDAVKAYAAAIADGDEARVCGVLSASSKKRFADADTKCEDAYKNFGGALTARQKERLKSIDPEVKVTGSKASSKIDEPPLEGEVRLTKEGGRWKLSLP